MNYYPFHLGDYTAHTAHLTWEEDLAYRRLLDLYYLHEKPVPADVQKLARLVRMPKQVPAIEAVLAEFFELRDDGWHNKRADDELARMSEKAEATEERDKHEKTRMQRYRERRSTMFEALRGAGVIPPFDIGQKDLQRLFDTHCNAPETSPKRNGDVSGDAPATAIPIPNTQDPTPKNYSVEAGKPAVDPADMTKEELWRAGKSLLEGAGVPKEQCGTFVGRLVKDYTDAVVIEAVRSAVVVTPADPKEYLKATCQRLAGERRRSLRPRNANPGMGELMEGAL